MIDFYYAPTPNGWKVAIMLEECGLNFKTNELMNYKLLLYSLAPVFYFFSTIFIFEKILRLLNIKYKILYLILIFFGSGLHYYAFERFSMTHVYEVFCVTILIYLLLIFYESDNLKNSIAGIIVQFFVQIDK